MKSKFTTIKLRPDVSIIVFEHSEQTEHTTEATTEPAETNSLAQLSNYRPLTVEKIRDEGEPKLPTINSKKNLPGQRNSQKKKTRTFKKGDEIPLLDEVIAPSIETPQLPEIPLEIKMIAAAPFFHVSKQKRVELFSASLKNVEKALQFKHRTDPAIKLPQEFHEFLELFSEKKKKLPPHRPYDHKINFIEGKQPGYGFLYSMSQGELQVLKKFLDENLAKGFIRASSSPATSPVLLFANQVEVSVFA